MPDQSVADSKTASVQNLTQEKTIPFGITRGIFAARLWSKTDADIVQVRERAYWIDPLVHSARIEAAYPKAIGVLERAGISATQGYTPNIFIDRCLPAYTARLETAARQYGIRELLNDNYSNVRAHCCLTALVAEGICRALWPDGNVESKAAVIGAVLVHDADKRIERERQKLNAGLAKLELVDVGLAAEVCKALEAHSSQLVAAIREPISRESYKIVQQFAKELFDIDDATAKGILLGGAVTGPNAHAEFIKIIGGQLRLDVSDLTKVIVRVCDDCVSGPDFGQALGAIVRPQDRALLSKFGTAPTHAWMHQSAIAFDRHTGAIEQVTPGQVAESHVAGDVIQSMNDQLLAWLRTKIPFSPYTLPYAHVRDDAAFIVAIARDYVRNLRSVP